MNRLTDLYRGSRVIFAGDINNLKIGNLLSTLPDLRNLVADPTHGSRVLDVIITDAHGSFESIAPPIGPDVAGNGDPSDHKVAIARPTANAGRRSGLSRYAMRTRRTLTTATLMMLSLCLATIDWSPMYDAGGIDSMVESFNSTLDQAINQYCPAITTRVRLNDKFYVSARLAELSAAKNKEYRKHKNSQRYRELKREVKIEIKESNKKKINDEITNAKGTYAWLKKIAKLSDRIGDKAKVEIKLPEHIEKGLTEIEQCEDIAAFISRISREYHPLSVEDSRRELSMVWPIILVVDILVLMIMLCMKL